MARIPIIDRTQMDAEQARVYDAAKASSGPVGCEFVERERASVIADTCAAAPTW